MVDSNYRLDTVPDDPVENARWRETILRLAEQSPRVREKVLEFCRKDFWYWAKGFAYLHETRVLDDEATFDELDTKILFLPWPHQIPVVNHILNVLGKKDVRLVKSRAQGASWLMILIACWIWLFHRGVGNFLSKDEKSVDNKGDMNSLFAKLDWLLAQLPEWMTGKQRKDWNRNYGDHTFTRMDGETAINGFACTPNVATGGRSLYAVMDEHGKHPRPHDKTAMASLQPTTQCRISLSTPFGTDGEFANLVHDETIDEPLLILAWWDNPTQNRGLYRVEKGVPVAVDEEKFGPVPYTEDEWRKLKPRLEERGYDLTSGQNRSPWYDKECLRQGADVVLVAQEYDMNFGASVARYFADPLVNRLRAGTIRRPYRGELHVNTEQLTGTWSENPDGRFKLWTELDIRKHPPMGQYIVSCDVAAGVGGEGSSNSSITVLNRRTGQKVLGFASPAILPYDLAEIAIAICRWFVDYKGDPAFLIWEDNGHGQEFRVRVDRSDFNFYYRRKASGASIYDKGTKIGGYWTQKKTALLGPYREALLEGYFDNPDKDAVEELTQYQFGTDGEPYHVAEKTKTDSAGAGAAHGDRVISDALAWHASLSFGDQIQGWVERNAPNVMNVDRAQVPVDSAAGRRKRYLETVSRNKQKSKW
jgi:hypothetical protein